MAKSESEKAALPAWFLIVGIGGLAGIALGAVLFFGGGSGTAASKAAPQAAAPAPKAGAAAHSDQHAAGVLTNLPTTFEGWKAEIDSAKADSYPALMDGALRVTDTALRARVVETLLVTWLNTSRESYLQYLDQVEGSDDEGKGVWPILVPAFVKAVPQLGEKAASSPDLEEAVEWMTDYYAEQDAPAALEWSKKWLLGDAQESAFATIAGQLSKTSLDQAVALARSLKSPNARTDALANIGSELGKQDPQKALAWAQALQDPAEKAAAIEEVMWSMSDADPAAAAQQVTRLNNPELLQSIGSTIAESLAAKNPANAMQWAEAIPAGAAQNEAVSGALSGWAKVDPKAAFAYFQSKHATNADAAEGIFEEWASNTPDAAAAQAKQIADPALREHAVTGVVNGWLNGNDPQAVEQWVDQLPVGHERDVASAAIVDALSSEEPQSAWDRALTIKDAQVRQQAVLSAFSGLAQNDPANARAAMAAQSLTAEDRKLLQPVLDAAGKAPQN
ncbi:MAG: hypothetical protein PHC88_15595 [Terrimicrobiaceae bacterium]|nr:hypothetical protein [Terrimicrobiaceae bacterium]